MYAIELDPGVRLDAEPHPEGTQEFITVFSGALTVLLDGERWGSAMATPSVSRRIGNTPMPMKETRCAA